LELHNLVALPLNLTAHVLDLASDELDVRHLPRLEKNIKKIHVYIVLDDFGPLGRSWRETDEAEADSETLIRNLLEGQYQDPVCIIAINVAEGWSRDMAAEIADEVRRRYVEHDEASASLLRFMDMASRH
jgi:hypothetical protein